MKRQATHRADGWIDVHAHFTTSRTPDELQAGWRMMQAGCFTLPAPFEWSVEGTLDHMDRNGIAMQLLSNVPKTAAGLLASNDYGASLVRRYPARFGLLAALPTDDPDAALAEIARSDAALRADGFAVTCLYNGVYLGDRRLDPVWAELDRRGAVVFMHPDAYARPAQGRPSPLLEVAFETARTIVDMLYAGTFARYPNIRFLVAHCGGALPALSGRLALLGAEAWVPNPERITSAQIKAQLSRLWLDTAATGTAHTIAPAVIMTGCDHLVYGSDCGVPCSTEATLSQNIQALFEESGLDENDVRKIGRNALRLFPALEPRIAAAAGAALAARAPA